MKLFKADESLTSIKIPCIKIFLSIVVLTVCFFRKRIFPTENRLFHTIATGITMVLVIGCIYCIAIALSECFQVMESKKVDHKTAHTSDTPIKVWTFEELFDFLQKEDMIELVIETDFGKKRVGVSSDYGKERFLDKDHCFDKCYYIETEEYPDLDAFKERFSQYVSDGTVKVWSAWLDDTELTI